MPAPPAGHKLFHHVPLLVALHREDALVAPLVVVAGNGSFKGCVQAFQPVFENVVEADQEGQPKAAVLQASHQFHQVKTAAPVSAWLHAHMPAWVDGEVRITPAFQPIKLGAIAPRPGDGIGEHHGNGHRSDGGNLRSFTPIATPVLAN